MRRTTFDRQLLHQPEGGTIARCVARCRPAEYKVWVKATADRYPVQSYLHRCRIAQSLHCPCRMKRWLSTPPFVRASEKTARRGTIECAQSLHRSSPSVLIHNGSYSRKSPCCAPGCSCSVGCKHGGGGAARSWAPGRLYLCGEFATGPGAGVALSQED
jgi:hypothetical protein